MTEIDVVNWTYEQASAELRPAANMGEMEKALDRVTRAVRRKALERLTQQSADRQVLDCPTCNGALNVVHHCVRAPSSQNSAQFPLRGVMGFAATVSNTFARRT